MIEYSVLCILNDAIATGAVEDIVRVLYANDFAVVGGSFGTFSPAEVAQLYRGNVNRSDDGRVEASWLARRSFFAGPGAKLLVRRSGGDSIAALARLKGSSHAGKAKDGTLRSVASFCQRGISIVHAPDSADDVWWHVEVLFGRAVAEAIKTRDDLLVAWDYKRVVDFCMPLSVRVSHSPEQFMREFIVRCSRVVAWDIRFHTLSATSPEDWRSDAPEVLSAISRLLSNVQAEDLSDLEYVGTRRLLVGGSLEFIRGVRGGLLASTLASAASQSGVVSCPTAEQLLMCAVTFGVD